MNHQFSLLKNKILKINPGVLFIIISGFFFAMVNISVKKLTHIPTMEIIFARSVVTLILTGFIIWQKKLPVIIPEFKILIMRGLFGTLSLSCYFYAIKFLPLAMAVTLAHLSPFFTIFFAMFLVKEKPNPWQWPFTILAFIGVVLMKKIEGNVSLYPFIVGIGSALFAGVAYNCIRLLKDKAHHFTIVFYFPLVGIPICLLTAGDWIKPTGDDWLWLLSTGFFTQLGQVYMTKAYLSERAAKISHFNFLAPIYATGLGLIIFGESIQILTLVGILIIGVGLYFSNYFSKSIA